MGYLIKHSTISGRSVIKLRAEGPHEAYTNSEKKIVEVLMSGQWHRRRAFVVGGGESIQRFDFSKLAKEKTIAVNRSAEMFDADIWYAMDITYYNMVKHGKLNEYTGEDVYKRWKEHPGVKVMLSPMNPYQLNGDVYVVRRLLERKVSFSLEEGIYGGNNSGFGAVMLAIALGANPIYLLGFDMRVSLKSHCHSGYPEQDLAVLKKKLREYKSMFEEIAPLLKKAHVDVVNLNKASELACFRYAEADEVLCSR